MLILDTAEKMICPTFAPFEFTTWKLGDEDSFCDISRLMGTEDEDDGSEAVDEHKFDVNAVPEPICDDMDYGTNYGKKKTSDFWGFCVIWSRSFV